MAFNALGSVRKSMKQVLHFALKQFITAAGKAQNPNDKSAFLSLIEQPYNYNKPWFKILKDDEFKFFAAVNYSILGKKINVNYF